MSMKKKKCITCQIEKYESKDNFTFRNDTQKFRNECKTCERARHRIDDKLRYDNMTVEEKKLYIKAKTEGNKKRFKTKPDALEKKKLYDKSDKGIFIRYRSDANRRSRNFSFELDFEQFSKLINSDCFYCGKENCRGVDRYNSSLGYTIENAVPCCGRCNEIKNDATVKELYKHLAKMVKHFKANKEMILR